MFHLATIFVGLQLVLAVPLEEAVATRQPAVSATEFLYQVLISELDESPKCGGVLVKEGFVVTSATCLLEFGGIKEFLEEGVLYGGGASLLFVLGTLSDAVVHPKYTLNPSLFDLAVVKYLPDEKSPKLNFTVLNGTWDVEDPCIMTSWWTGENMWPDRLMWEPVAIKSCSPLDPNMLCFEGETTNFLKSDLGSPIVCGGVLAGLVSRGGGKQAINITNEYEWVTTAIRDLEHSHELIEPATEDMTKLYLIKILQRLDNLPVNRTGSGNDEDHFDNWNKQIVIPLSYVLFAMVIFFFVLLFFIIIFTVVLVYYSRK